ncbi:MAG: TIGR04282 family arsenosugar biosynthesis glycosyltransferase [Thermoleophilaceae bacterium]
MGASVLVMAKAPRPGAVKTRLAPLLGDDGCAALQATLIGVATRWAAAVAAPGGAYLAYGPDGAAEDELRPHVPDGVRLFPDGRGDLGDRLAAATARVLGERRDPLLVVGTDMATLTLAHARDAEVVLRGGADAVFGPALDGGYWMVGLARPAPELFELGTWGGPDVLERSLELAAAAGLRAELLGFERDLDDVTDARALLEHPSLPAQVAEALAPAAAT